jgi:hypothetical protein
MKAGPALWQAGSPDPGGRAMRAPPGCRSGPWDPVETRRNMQILRKSNNLAKFGSWHWRHHSVADATIHGAG